MVVLRCDESSAVGSRLGIALKAHGREDGSTAAARSRWKERQKEQHCALERGQTEQMEQGGGGGGDRLLATVIGSPAGCWGKSERPSGRVERLCNGNQVALFDSARQRGAARLDVALQVTHCRRAEGAGNERRGGEGTGAV